MLSKAKDVSRARNGRSYPVASISADMSLVDEVIGSSDVVLVVVVVVVVGIEVVVDVGFAKLQD